MEFDQLLSYLGIPASDLRLKQRIIEALRNLGLAAARALCRKLADEATCKSILGWAYSPTYIILNQMIMWLVNLIKPKTLLVNFLNNQIHFFIWIFFIY